MAKGFIAGQLRHARELSALFAPSVNSYKRLVPGYEAPVYIGWSRRNRSALVRVPVYHPGKEKATRMELRCPDPSCNPYLTFAALLQAGLEGIEKGYELPEPIERNLYDLHRASERQAMGVEHLPESLGEAIEEMAGSELVEKALGEHIFARYVDAEAPGVGGLPGPGHAVGARPLPGGDLTARVGHSSADPHAARRPPGDGGRRAGRRRARAGRGDRRRATPGRPSR